MTPQPVTAGVSGAAVVSEAKGAALPMSEGAPIEVRCPVDGHVIGRLADDGPEIAAATAVALRKAQPAWEALGPRGRAVHMRRWLDWILDNERQLLELIQAEAGKSSADASMEIVIAIDVLNYFIDNAASFLADRHVRPAGVVNVARRLRVQVRPFPLVGLITPWNAPLAGPMMDCVGALAAGAAVLCKPSEITPLTWNEAVRGWRDDLGLPPVLGVVNGRGATGAAVVDEVDMVAFTGSMQTGRMIARRAADRLIPVSLELGGKDAMIVLADADIERAASAAVWGSMANVGQGCISVERVYVEAAVYDRFVAGVTDKVRALRQGVDPPGSYTTDIGVLVTDAQADIVESHVRDAIAKGAQVLVGGQRRTAGSCAFEPTVIVGVNHTMACMTEETFGPTLPIMKVSDEDEALRLANDSAYGLSSSLWTGDAKRANRVARRIEAGSVTVNDVLVAAFQLPVPMGGWKSSGLGARFGGAHGLLKYCRQQTVVTNRLYLRSEPTWFPVDPRRSRAIAAVVRFLGAHDWRRRLGRTPRS